MVTRIRVLAFGCLLLLLANSHAHGTPYLADTSALQFLGFRAGSRLEELAAQLERMGGTRMRCHRSRLDIRVHECRAVVEDTGFGRPVSLWISAMDSLAGVIMLSTTVAPGQLERWRETLENRYGRVGPRIQGTQWMLQWVRRGRMLRLTWRLERGEKIASVSLVDGHVLDGWGRTRARLTASSPRSTPEPK